MATTVKVDPVVEDEFEREEAALLQRAKEKPTLQMINAEEALPIAELQRRYSELALLIEVTKEDFSQVYEGKLIATAERSIEFLDLDKECQRRGIVTLTAYGDPRDPRPMPLPSIYYFGVPLPE
jgi:hypothetical protein